MGIFQVNNDTKKGLPVLAITISSIVLIAAFVIGIFTINRINPLSPIFKKNEKDRLVSLWEKNQFDDIIATSNSILAKHPNDGIALAFRGFASFYKGTSQLAETDQLPFFNSAISDLRRAKLNSIGFMEPQINYILGKSYYYKGYYYHDSAIKFLEMALKQNYINSDIYEYLGLSYFSRKDWNNALKNFMIAEQKKPSEFLQLTIAQTYKELHNVAEAEKYFKELATKASAVTIKQLALIEIAKMSLANDDLTKAEENCTAALAINDKSADALYVLGLIYEKKGDAAMARDYWRKAVKINPLHADAQEKLKL